MPWILEVLEGLNVPAISKVGYEADDVIGFLAKKAAAEGFDVYMMTPDKDFGQLVTDKIRMFRPGRGGNQRSLGPDEIREKFDVNEPLQVIDLLGMMGDSADNIPGIPGVGAKTASSSCINTEVWKGSSSTRELKGKLKERVEENTELALLSKELATICLDIPMEYDWASMTLDAPQAETLRGTLEDLEFRTLARRILGDAASTTAPAGTAAPTPAAADEPAQLDLFGGGETGGEASEAASGYRTAKDTSTDYQLVATTEALDALIEALQASDTFAFDTETSSLDVMTTQLVGISLSVAAESGFWVPATCADWSEQELLERLQPVFADADKRPSPTISNLTTRCSPFEASLSTTRSSTRWWRIT